MFEYLIHDNSLVRDVLQKEGIGNDELEFIKSLILARDIPVSQYIIRCLCKNYNCYSHAHAGKRFPCKGNYVNAATAYN